MTDVHKVLAGEWITYVARDGVFYARVGEVRPNGFFMPLPDPPSQFVPLYLSINDWGTTWMPGRWDAQSKEVRTVRTAQGVE